MVAQWKPNFDTTMLDERMDNAMRRASGGIGFDVAFDKGRMRALKDTTSDALEAEIASAGPLFLRLGQGAFAAGSCTVGEALNPKEVGAEILYEFHAEAAGAFQAAKAALYADALEHLRREGMGEAQRNAILAAADGAFRIPDKEAFTKIGLPYVKTVATPGTQAALGGVGGFLCALLLVRAPHFAFFTGVLTGGAAYYLARKRIRTRCEELLHHLPRKVYDMLATEWNSNARRYADTVNAGVATSGKTEPDSAP